MGINLDNAHRVLALLVKAHGHGSAAVAGAPAHVLGAVDVSQGGVVISVAQGVQLYTFHHHVAVVARKIAVVDGQMRHEHNRQPIAVKFIRAVEQGLEIGLLALVAADVGRSRCQRETGGVGKRHGSDNGPVAHLDDVLV